MGALNGGSPMSPVTPVDFKTIECCLSNLRKGHVAMSNLITNLITFDTATWPFLKVDMRHRAYRRD